MPLRRVRGNWHYRFQVTGHIYTANTSYPATKRARATAERVEVRARELVLAGTPQLLRLEPKPFDEAMAAFLEWTEGEHRGKPSTYRRLAVSATSLLKFFGTAPVASLTASQIEEFKAQRRRQGIAEVTIRHDLHCLGPMLRYCRLRHWLGEADPLASVEIPSDKDAVRMHVLTLEEETQYFETCLNRGYSDLHDLGRLMLRQGCRPSELLALQPADVDIAGALLRIRSGKTDAARRSLRLASESRHLLAGRALRTSLWVFPSRHPDLPISRLDGSHARVLKQIGYGEGEGFVIYDLRHTFATRAALGGMDLPTLAAILGHLSIRCVMRYIHVSQAHQNEAMDRLDAVNHLV